MMGRITPLSALYRFLLYNEMHMAQETATVSSPGHARPFELLSVPMLPSVTQRDRDPLQGARISDRFGAC